MLRMKQKSYITQNVPTYIQGLPEWKEDKLTLRDLAVSEPRVTNSKATTPCRDIRRYSKKSAEVIVSLGNERRPQANREHGQGLTRGRRTEC